MGRGGWTWRVPVVERKTHPNCDNSSQSSNSLPVLKGFRPIIPIVSGNSMSGVNRTCYYHPNDKLKLSRYRRLQCTFGVNIVLCVLWELYSPWINLAYLLLLSFTFFFHSSFVNGQSFRIQVWVLHGSAWLIKRRARMSPWFGTKANSRRHTVQKRLYSLYGAYIDWLWVTEVSDVLTVVTYTSPKIPTSRNWSHLKAWPTLTFSADRIVSSAALQLFSTTLSYKEFNVHRTQQTLEKAINDEQQHESFLASLRTITEKGNIGVRCGGPGRGRSKHYDFVSQVQCVLFLLLQNIFLTFRSHF